MSYFSELVRRLKGTRDAILPGIDRFPAVDLDQLARELKIDERAAENGRQNQPQHYADAPDLTELEIRAEFERRVRSAADEYRDQMSIYDARIGRAIISADQRVRIEAHSFYFEPNRIVVHAGQPVELTVKNGATFVPHNFSCVAGQAGTDVHQDVGMFREQEVTRFTPTEPGEYPFFCSKDGHTGKGMKGTLVVVR